MGANGRGLPQRPIGLKAESLFLVIELFLAQCPLLQQLGQLHQLVGRRRGGGWGRRRLRVDDLGSGAWASVEIRLLMSSATCLNLRVVPLSRFWSLNGIVLPSLRSFWGREIGSNDAVSKAHFGKFPLGVQAKPIG